MTIDPGRPGDPKVGLCFDCVHARRVQTSRGSTFWMCEMSSVDARFPKYPALPGLRCRGYVDGAAGGDP